MVVERRAGTDGLCSPEARPAVREWWASLQESHKADQREQTRTQQNILKPGPIRGASMRDKDSMHRSDRRCIYGSSQAGSRRPCGRRSAAQRVHGPAPEEGRDGGCARESLTCQSRKCRQLLPQSKLHRREVPVADAPAFPLLLPPYIQGSAFDHLRQIDDIASVPKWLTARR